VGDRQLKEPVAHFAGSSINCRANALAFIYRKEQYNKREENDT